MVFEALNYFASSELSTKNRYRSWLRVEEPRLVRGWDLVRNSPRRGQLSILVIGLTYLESLSFAKDLETSCLTATFSEKKPEVRRGKSKEHTRKNTGFALERKVCRLFSESNFNFPSLLRLREIRKLGKVCSGLKGTIIELSDAMSSRIKFCNFFPFTIL